MSAELVKPIEEYVGIGGNKSNLKAAVIGKNKVNP